MHIYTIIIISILGFCVLILISLLGIALKRKPEAVDAAALIDMGSVKTLLASLEARLAQQDRSINEMRSILNTGAQQQNTLQLAAEHAKSNLEKLAAFYEEHKATDAANRQSLQKLEAIISGTKSKGIAGENILKEILGNFPAEMIVRDFKVKGKTVEFGLVLTNGKIVPLDSKWTSSDLLEALAASRNDQEKQKIVEQIRKVVARRVQEVSQYIDTTLTFPWAIAAVPDSIHSLCADEYLDAYRKDHVILVSYSMVLPYLLTLYSMQLQYGSAIDAENLKNYLVDIKRNLAKMDDILTNYIDKSCTMIKNASDSYRQMIGAIKNSVTSIESAKTKEE